VVIAALDSERSVTYDYYQVGVENLGRGQPADAG